MTSSKPDEEAGSVLGDAPQMSTMQAQMLALKKLGLSETTLSTLSELKPRGSAPLDATQVKIRRTQDQDGDEFAKAVWDAIAKADWLNNDDKLPYSDENWRDEPEGMSQKLMKSIALSKIFEKHVLLKTKKLGQASNDEGVEKMFARYNALRFNNADAFIKSVDQSDVSFKKIFENLGVLEPRNRDGQYPFPQVNSYVFFLADYALDPKITKTDVERMKVILKAAIKDGIFEDRDNLNKYSSAQFESDYKSFVEKGGRDALIEAFFEIARSVGDLAEENQKPGFYDSKTQIWELAEAKTEEALAQTDLFQDYDSGPEDNQNGGVGPEDNGDSVFPGYPDLAPPQDGGAPQNIDPSELPPPPSSQFFDPAPETSDSSDEYIQKLEDYTEESREAWGISRNDYNSFVAVTNENPEEKHDRVAEDALRTLEEKFNIVKDISATLEDLMVNVNDEINNGPGTDRDKRVLMNNANNNKRLILAYKAQITEMKTKLEEYLAGSDDASSDGDSQYLEPAQPRGRATDEADDEADDPDYRPDPKDFIDDNRGREDELIKKMEPSADRRSVVAAADPIYKMNSNVSFAVPSLTNTAKMFLIKGAPNQVKSYTNAVGYKYFLDYTPQKLTLAPVAGSKFSVLGVNWRAVREIDVFLNDLKKDPNKSLNYSYGINKESVAVYLGKAANKPVFLGTRMVVELIYFD